jgi:hypothetical protein
VRTMNYRLLPARKAPIEQHHSHQAERTEREISGAGCFGHGLDNFDLAVVAQANLVAGNDLSVHGVIVGHIHHPANVHYDSIYRAGAVICDGVAIENVENHVCSRQASDQTYVVKSYVAGAGNVDHERLGCGTRQCQSGAVPKADTGHVNHIPPRNSGADCCAR